ncbi:hypothetical protein AK812_SmicGene29127 [Symbiodinium microadriaticum]|uniref:Uncharacterized protein n=1 Tax=Symbiodinium microadriaticum TaxID=2951 RepID=A0A1Q9D2P2_SYMMI|nr:hypothetical protein AK812_SmicGene29127 [Symbiodinium microadriaticum]
MVMGKEIDPDIAVPRRLRSLCRFRGLTTAAAPFQRRACQQRHQEQVALAGPRLKCADASDIFPRKKKCLYNSVAST